MNDGLKKKLESLGISGTFVGKTHTEEAKAAMSAHKKVAYIGEGNPFFGKTPSEYNRQRSREWHEEYGFAGEKSSKFRKDISNDTIRDLFKQGNNCCKIAKIMNICDATVYNRCKTMGIYPNVK